MSDSGDPSAPARPSSIAGALAIAGAAMIVSVGIALAMGALALLPFVMAVTLAIAAVIGMPVFLLLRATGGATLLKAGAGGFMTGALVPALLVLPGPAAQEASIGGVETVANHHYTAAGWLQNLELIAGFGVAGIAGALIAWLLLGMIAPVSAQRRLDLKASGALAALTITLFAGAAAIPWAMMDRSCHNPMRDGRTSIAPMAAFELHLPMREWPAARAELERFVAARGWSIQADVRTDRDFPWFQASLCTEPGTQILLNAVPFDGGYLSVDAFQPQGGDSWQAPLRDLQRRLEHRWPGAVRYGDGPASPPRPPWAPPSPTPTAKAK